MADVQTEHGHLRIANALWEAWTIADLTAAELRVLFALVRLSYGWGRKETAMRGTKPRPASAATLQRMTGLDPKGVRRAVKGLCMKQVVRRVTEHDSEAGEAAVYAPNKDFDSWSPGVLPGTWEPSKQDPTPGQDTPGQVAPSPPGTVTPPPPGKLPPPYKDKGERQREEEERVRAEQPGPSRRWNIAALWGQLAPRFGAGKTSAPRQPDAINAARLLDIIDHSTDDEIDARLARCAGKGSPLGYFVALFDDEGKATPLTQRKVEQQKYGEERAIALRNDAHDLADVLRANEKDCTPENVGYWIQKHGKPWTVEELRPLTRRVLIDLGIAS